MAFFVSCGLEGMRLSDLQSDIRANVDEREDESDDACHCNGVGRYFQLRVDVPNPGRERETFVASELWKQS